MNLFGLEITISKNGNTPVKRKECHEAHNKLEEFLNTRFDDLNQRITDIKDFLLRK